MSSLKAGVAAPWLSGLFVFFIFLPDVKEHFWFCHHQVQAQQLSVWFLLYPDMSCSWGAGTGEMTAPYGDYVQISALGMQQCCVSRGHWNMLFIYTWSLDNQDHSQKSASEPLRIYSFKMWQSEHFKILIRIEL